MSEVHYFANIRETLGIAREQVPVGTATTVSALIETLVQTHGSRWQSVFNADNKVLVAVNQVIVPRTAAIKDGDEVAFFPPVTGG